LKIVISPYLSRKSSEYDEIWCADSNFDPGDGNVTKIQKFPNSRWRTEAILKIIFGYNSAPYCPIKTKFGVRRLIARTQWFGDENAKFRKSMMADGRQFENHYISISQPQIVRIARNLVCGHKFYRRLRKRQKIRNSQIQHGGWTAH